MVCGKTPEGVRVFMHACKCRDIPAAIHARPHRLWYQVVALAQLISRLRVLRTDANM